MASAVDRLKAVKAEIDRRTRERDRLEGRREQLMKQLKDEFGHDDLASARAEADKLDAELDAMEADLEQKIGAMERKLR